MEIHLLARGPVLLLALLVVGLNSQEQPVASSGLVDDLGEAPNNQRVQSLDDSPTRPSRRQLRMQVSRRQELGGPATDEEAPPARETRSVGNGTAAPGVAAAEGDELDHTAKLNRLFSAEHAGGLAMDSEQSARRAYAHDKKRLPLKSTNRSLALAGTSGEAPKCEIEADQMTVSGTGEAACVIQEPLLTDRLSPVEISFDVEFLRYPNTDPGRSGGIFYGSTTADSNKENQPTIGWSDRPVDKGYHVFGNTDTNKAYGLSPGNDPDKSWKLLIQMDGKATFIAGPRRWLKNFTPKIKGNFLGFWVGVGSIMRIRNYRAVALPAPGTDFKDDDKPLTNKYYPGIQLEVYSRPDYGNGVARFFYSEQGGDKYQPKCVYLEGPTDFRTLHGSIYASQDLYAAHSLILQDHTKQAADGDLVSSSGARLYFIANGQARYDDTSVYLSHADFRAPKSHIHAGNVIRAGSELQIASKYGQRHASLWYSETGDSRETDTSLLLQHGDFSTEAGSIEASTIRANENVVIKSMDGFGQGSARFWYSQIGGEDPTNSVFLKGADFRTEMGSVSAAKDVGGASLKLGSSAVEGTAGEATLRYLKSGDGKYGSNTVHILGSSLSARKASVSAKKDVHVGRSLYVSASQGGQSAELWYSRRSSEGIFHDTSLYLRSGDMATQTNSIHSARDVVAQRHLQIGVGGGGAQLWHSAVEAGKHSGQTLYLKRGDFVTETGDIHATDIATSKHLSVKALEGYGNGKASLYYKDSRSQGQETGSLTQKNGDFRLEAGSIYSKTVVAGQGLKLGARPSFGSGEAELWYVEVPVGSQDLFAKTMYVKSASFGTEDGSIMSGGNMGGQSIHLASHGDQAAPVELWYGRAGGDMGSMASGPPSVVYVRSGDFETGNGNMVASEDIRVANGELQISAHEGYGESTQQTVTAQLWYSHLGVDAVNKETLNLKYGGFSADAGSIEAANDITAASGTIEGKEAKAGKLKCDKCHFNKIYLTTDSEKSKGAHALRESLVLLDEGTAKIDVGLGLAELSTRRQELLNEQSRLKSAILKAETMLLDMQSRIQARRML